MGLTGTAEPVSSGVQDAVRCGPGAGRPGNATRAQRSSRAAADLIRRLRAREREIEDAIFARVSGMFMVASGEDADYEAGLRARSPRRSTTR